MGLPTLLRLIKIAFGDFGNPPLLSLGSPSLKVDSLAK
jgi:hypothetical protein